MSSKEKVREFVNVRHYVSRISESGSKLWAAPPNGGMKGDRGGDSAVGALNMVVREAIQ